MMDIPSLQTEVSNIFCLSVIPHKGTSGYHARGSQAIHDEMERINMLSGRLKTLSLEGKDTRS